LKIRVTEYSGEIDKIKRIFNYDMRIDLNAPDFKERFFKKREEALLRYLEMREGGFLNGSSGNLQRQCEAVCRSNNS